MTYLSTAAIAAAQFSIATAVLTLTPAAQAADTNRCPIKPECQVLTTLPELKATAPGSKPYCPPRRGAGSGHPTSGSIGSGTRSLPSK